MAPAGGRRATRAAAFFVALGILLSRLAGLIRERVIAHYFGTSLFADVFRAALRTPNVLQNLLGEGALSASFIPVYAELLEEGREEEAGKVAGAVLGLLVALAGGLALLGIALAPVFVTVLLPGFTGLRHDLCVYCIRILFPMTGLLVLSAWALGVLNSHRQFFVSYVAPVLWNCAMIVTLVTLGGVLQDAALVQALAWGALAGGALQLALQLPFVLRLERRLRVRLDLRLAAVREILRNAGPAILGRGVVQLSGWVDMVLGSLLAMGAVAALGYAQTLYLLPVSLFGMSVAAAELPELSRQRSQAADVLRERVSGGLRRIALLVVPSMVGYLLLGDQVVGAIYQTGSFNRDDTLLVYLVLCGYSLGLFASTSTRLFSSAFFALHDTRTPARTALLRVTLAAGLGAALAFQLDQFAIAGRRLGPVGLALATGVAAWVEWVVLRRRLRRAVGAVGAGRRPLAKMVLAATLAALLGRGLLYALPPLHPLITATCSLGLFGAAYFGIAHLLRLEDATALVARVARRLRLT